MAEAPRILLLKAHAGENAGVTAGSQAMRKALAGQGKLVSPADDYDVVVVNADLPANGDPLRLSRCIAALQRALDQGKRGYLVNLTWNDAIPVDAAFLRQLSGLGVRGSASARTIAERFGVGCDIMLDMAYYGAVETAAVTSPHAGRIVAAGLKPAEVALLGKITGEQVVELPPLAGWAESVTRLASARLLVTRRYNEVLAACKARTSFVALDDGPEIADLLETSRTTIPAARRIRELTPVVEWALENRDVYAKMFAWMARMRPWAGLRTPAPPDKPRLRQIQRGVGAAAVVAEIRHDYVEAEAHWRTLLDERPQDASIINRYCQMALKARLIAKGALTYIRGRQALPGFISYPTISVAVADAALWRYRGPLAPAWWAAAVEAIALADAQEPYATVEAAVEACLALAAADGPEMQEAALVLITERLVQLHWHDLAYKMLAKVRPAASADARLFDLVRLDCLHRHYNEAVAGRFASLRASPQWQDARTRLLVRKLEWLVLGAGAIDLNEAMQDARLPGTFRAAAALQAVGIAWDRGRVDEARSMIAADRELIAQAGSCVVVASVVAESPDLARDAAELQRAQRLSELSRGMDRNTQDFLRRLADPGASVAVVGNSSIECGRGNGPAIDGHDIVIRFNSFSVEEKYVADYGRRTDIVISARTVLDHVRRENLRPDVTVVIACGLARFQARNWGDILSLSAQGIAFAQMPETYRTELFGILGAVPSSGVHCVYLLNKLRQGLKGVSLFGFSFTDQEQSKAGSNHYFEKAVSAPIHHWAAEAHLVHSLVKPDGGVG